MGRVISTRATAVMLKQVGQAHLRMMRYERFRKLSGMDALSSMSSVISDGSLGMWNRPCQVGGSVQGPVGANCHLTMRFCMPLALGAFSIWNHEK
jgi:hypothetical protein